MPIDRFYVRGLAEDFVQTITKLSAKEREKPVMPRYAAELNKLIALGQEVAPEHDPRLWPRPIEVAQQDMGLTQVFATYADVDTAARQIVTLLPHAPLLGALG